MRTLEYYQIDAFTSTQFKGNPAGVALLERPISDKLMQQIAAENGQSETAFLLKKVDKYEIRWFTPTYEIDLCGHATLASAFVLLELKKVEEKEVEFYSPHSGLLRAKLINESIELNFPSRPAEKTDIPLNAKSAFGIEPLAAFASRDLMLVYENQQQIEQLKPVSSQFKDWDYLGVICTAPGEDTDFVSRVFDAREFQIEDPVTGSAHCNLIPYWSVRLGKDELVARQLSKREGELVCTMAGDRVLIKGNCMPYLKGKVIIPD